MSNKVKPGTGVTFYEITNELTKRQSAQYVNQLKSFGRNSPSKKAIEDMDAAFKDGMSSMLHALREMGVIAVLREGEEIDEVKP